jgi:hypothetical protein
LIQNAHAQVRLLIYRQADCRMAGRRSLRSMLGAMYPAGQLARHWAGADGIFDSPFSAAGLLGRTALRGVDARALPPAETGSTVFVTPRELKVFADMPGQSY